MENVKEFEMNSQNILAVDEICSKLEKFLEDKPYEHYYYAYIATHKCLTSARLLAKYTKENIEKEVDKILDPCLQRNEIVGSKANLNIDDIKTNYSEILNYIDIIVKTLDKIKYNLGIAVLVSFKTYIIDVAFIKRDIMIELNEFADKYSEDK